MSDLEQPLIIDLRKPQIFAQKGMEGSINIPIAAILDQEYEQVFGDSNAKVLYADDPVNAHEAWMLLTQMGYKEIYVLKSW